MEQVSNLTDNFFKFNLPEKLRQRLSQRPACAEAAAELNALSRQLENEDLRTFAAACSEGVAACQGTAENYVSETEALLRSARLHIDEELEVYKLGLPTMWDSLYYAIDAISKATDIYEQLGATHLAVTCLMELAKAMLRLCRPHDAIQAYQKALDINKSQNGTRERLVILRNLAAAQIQAGLLVDALNTYEEVLLVSGVLKTTPVKVIGWYRELARQCELRQLLILLIIEPSSKSRISSYQSQLLDFFRNPQFDESSKFVSFMEPLELILVKGFVLAIARRDFRRSLEASEKLFAFLDEAESAFVDYLFDLVPHPAE